MNNYSLLHLANSQEKILSEISNIIVKPIAFVKNEYKEAKGRIPRDSISKITLIEEFPKESLIGIEDFSHLEIIFYFHKSTKIVLGKSHPRNNKHIQKVGIFSHRSPHRTNHIGVTIVKLLKREGRTLIVSGLDALDGTPVLDIKPVVNHLLPKEKVKQPNWVNK